MTKRFEAIRIIGFLLALLYVISLAFYALYIPVDPFRIHAVLLVVLLTVLFAATLGIYGRQRQARYILIGGNFLLGMYTLGLAFVFPRVVSWMFGIGALAFGVYFSSRDVQAHFRAAPRQGHGILVIDDDEILIRTVRNILTAHGYTVNAAHNGEDGIHMAKHQRPDLILLDVILPGIKGREVCRRLKADKDTKHIPVIFITAKDSQDDIEAEMKAGGEAHLTKPVNRESLLLTVQGVIKG